MFKMKKRYIKMCIIVAVPIALLGAVTYASNLSLSKEKDAVSVSSNSNNIEETETVHSILESIFGGKDIGEKQEEKVDTNVTEEEKVVLIHPTEIDREPNSITVLVNKELSLPKDYEPDDLVIPNVSFAPTASNDNSYLRQIAATHLEQLFEGALREGIVLNAVSGYRSYERQYKIFTNNIKYKGLSHTADFSAKPGYSEHQTGLAIDVSSKSARNQLEEKFGNTIEGIWLASNAHKYGFFIRYPEHKTEITGYAYEPWHIRYVGKELATYLYESDLTLEEYYNFVPSIDFDTELRFDTLWKYGIDMKDVIKPTPTPTLTPEETEEETLNGELLEEELVDGELVDGEILDGELVDGELTNEDELEQVEGKEDGVTGKDKNKKPQSTPVPTETVKEPITPTPTLKPTKAPTLEPTNIPTQAPITTPEPTKAPTVTPTEFPHTDSITPSVPQDSGSDTE